jgi:hypothetical protein
MIRDFSPNAIALTSTIKAFDSSLRLILANRRLSFLVRFSFRYCCVSISRAIFSHPPTGTFCDWQAPVE